MDARISGAAAGDRDALGQLLFERHDKLARLVARKIPASLQSRLDVEDVLQAYADAFRDIGKFQPRSDRAFYRWLETIVEHRLLDMVRGLKAKKRGGDRKQIEKKSAAETSTVADLFDVLAVKMPTPSMFAARDEGVQALQVQLAGLPDDYREAVRLHHLEGHDLEEVARMMDRPPDAVRGILYRARKKLRDGMGRSSLWLSKGYGSHDNNVKLWDARTGREILTLKGHNHPVNSVVFSPDGRRIVSGSNGNTVKVWDATTGKEALTINGHKDKVTSVAFSPSGQWIVSGSTDKTIKIWDAANLPAEKSD